MTSPNFNRLLLETIKDGIERYGVGGLLERWQLDMGELDYLIALADPQDDNPEPTTDDE